MACDRALLAAIFREGFDEHFAEITVPLGQKKRGPS
jgi:hypothetical protein